MYLCTIGVVEHARIQNTVRWVVFHVSTQPLQDSSNRSFHLELPIYLRMVGCGEGVGYKKDPVSVPEGI